MLGRNFKQMDYPTKVRLSIQKLPLKQRKKDTPTYTIFPQKEKPER